MDLLASFPISPHASIVIGDIYAKIYVMTILLGLTMTCGSNSCARRYYPVAHWIWGNGWLAKMGVLDFAGGIVLHVSHN